MQNFYHDNTPSFFSLDACRAWVKLEAPAQTEQAWVVTYLHGDERLDALEQTTAGAWEGQFPFRQGSKVH